MGDRRHAPRPPIPDGACARVTWLRGEPTAIDRAADVFKLALMPEIQTFDGFCGVSFLINRETGLAVTSVAFDSRAALEGTRERARGLRAGAPPKPDWRSWK